MNPDLFEPPVSRRTALKSAIALAGAAALAQQQTPAAESSHARAPKRYQMKKSINLWAFPYPAKMNLRQCLQLARDAGFDGIELNYDLESDLSPKAGPADLKAIRKMADEIGIEISGLCSFLYWPYPLTSNDEARRRRGLELGGMMAQSAHDLGASGLTTFRRVVLPLIVPALAPHAPYTVSTEHLKAVRAMSDKHNAPVVTHIAENSLQTLLLLQLSIKFLIHLVRIGNRRDRFIRPGIRHARPRIGAISDADAKFKRAKARARFFAALKIIL